VYYAINIHATGTVTLVYKWQPLPFAWALVAGSLALIVVSLLTRAEDAGRVESFFAKQGTDLLLLDLPGWFTRARWKGFARRYREDLLGLGHGYLTVAGLILLAWFIMRIK